MAESEKIFSKYLLPVHQKFSNHITLFKQFPCLTLEAKIKIYTLKVMKNLENAKGLCKYENTNEKQSEKYPDELELQTIDLDYDTIHSEILDNIIFDENDSGLSDFDSTEEENEKKKIFNINKIKIIIHKSVKSLFTECQEDDQFKPLIQQEKDILNEENISKENLSENKSTRDNTYNEIKTQENTNDISEDINENKINNNNSNDMIIEKEKIINFKKYNFYTDPYSNYNNFTKKYKVKNNTKKRFRDIHPFLKTFNPKFLKKENIDKKIFRKFRKLIKRLFKDNKNITIFNKNYIFWKKFYNKNLLPPMKIILNNELIEHKSFNTQYLLWLFNQEGTTDLFKLFIKEESEKVINNFISEYNLNQSKEPKIIEKLKEYINNIPEIYGSYNKKEISQENKEIFETNELSGKKEEEDNSNLESFEEGIAQSNPFNLNFELIEKKNFKEIPYDGNHFNKFRNINYHDVFKKYEEIEIENEKLGFDYFPYRQLTINDYK